MGSQWQEPETDLGATGTQAVAAGAGRAGIRRLARRLELRSFSLTPEYFTLPEGLRAALAVAVPLLLVLGTRHGEYGWAVFAAFWTCLCDGAGPVRMHRRLLAGFVLMGVLSAFFGSWISSFSSDAGMITGPVLVFLSIFLPYRIPQAGLVATLLAVVAVVAVGFPKPLQGAAVQAGAFFAGAAWAWLLINVFWRIDAYLPLKQASAAVIARLSDMAEDLAATGPGPHRDEGWHSEHGEHRRSVRIALERLRGLLLRYESEPAGKVEPYRATLSAAEGAFSALIALDHIFIVRHGSLEERATAAQAMFAALAEWQAALRDGRNFASRLNERIAIMKKVRGTISDDALRGCLIGTGQALATVARGSVASPLPSPAASVPAGWMPALQQALRQSAGVVIVYYVARLFDIGYPYWATMAVIVVLQGALRITLTRSIERIFGSLLGGTIAFGLLYLHPPAAFLVVLAIPLAGVTIALRGVNYTVFVVFLTMLFIIVTELLQPGAGIASARILDNMIGSIAALFSMFALWPDFGKPLKVLLQNGLDANRDYIDAVATRQEPVMIAEARRKAGLASIEAEFALHELKGLYQRLRGLSKDDAAALMELRRLAGDAAMGWHHLQGRKERFLARREHDV